MDLKKQNILFFTRTMKLGGTENVVLQLCESFHMIVNKIIVCSCGGVNVEILTRLGIKHYILPDIENKSPYTVIKTLKKISEIVRKENITLIHTHHRMAAFYVSLLGLYKKCYFINTAHNTFNNRKKFTRFAYKHANLIACGEMVKQNLVTKFDLPVNQVTVIYNAVKAFDGMITTDSLIEDLHKQKCFIVGNIGRLSKQKGMSYFIQSIPEVLKKYPQTRFLIIGVGEDEQKLRRLVSENEIDDFVFFMGYRKDIQNLISQLDLVVLSSLWEGLPLTPIETFSVGKTIVATAVDGTKEIIEDNKNGLLVEPGNAREMAEKINWMIEHPSEKTNMEKAALEKYYTQFSFDKFVQNYIDYYERM